MKFETWDADSGPNQQLCRTWDLSPATIFEFSLLATQLAAGEVIQEDANATYADGPKALQMRCIDCSVEAVLSLSLLYAN